MARKKTEKPDEGKPENYDVLIGFVHSFEYHNGNERGMNGHPFVGRCYRIIKDPTGYRLHIGADKNEHHLDGLFLGKELENEVDSFSFNIEIVTPGNYLTLPIHNDDANSIIEWITNESKDLWDKIKMESVGDAVVVKSLDDLKKVLKRRKRAQEELPIAPIEPDYSDPTTSDYLTSLRINAALTLILSKDPEFLSTIAGLLEYLSSCYEDKYENGEIPNASKLLLTRSQTLGKGAAVFNIMKYTQRYATTGFRKSENVEDLLKIIHYALFEVQRQKYNQSEFND